MHSQSKLAGHVLSVRDRRSPVPEAHLEVDFREVTSRGDGLYEVALDSLPLQVELRISARGYHPHRELINWAPVAAGGLILRDFYLIPEDQPVPVHRASSISHEPPPIRPAMSEPDEEDDLLLDDGNEWDEDLEVDDAPRSWDAEYETSFDDDLWASSDPDRDADEDVEISLDPAFFPAPRLKPR
jgi:hypothetical protein